jgi:hypothetical protein
MKNTPDFRLLSLWGAVAAALLGVVGSAHGQAYSWQGSTGANPNDPTNSANYTGTPPMFNGATNASGSFWTKDGSSTMIYSSAQGTTTFSGTGANSLTWLGWNTAGGTGGTAGQQTVQVTGGTLNLNGSFTNDTGTEGLWVGNSGTTTGGFLTINGGNVSVANGTLIGRGGAVGLLSISNGSFSTGAFSTAVGMYIGANFSGTGAGTLTIQNAGQFTLTATANDPFVFGTALASTAHAGTTDYVNFTTGSTGKITLNLSSATLGTSYFNTLITNGYVEIGGVVDTTPADYAIDTSNLAASTLQLAVPEPSTWMIFGGGLTLLTVVSHLRRRGAATA